MSYSSTIAKCFPGVLILVLGFILFFYTEQLPLRVIHALAALAVAYTISRPQNGNISSRFRCKVMRENMNSI